MHYDVDYTKETDLFKKQQSAIADIIEYMGQERFDKLTLEFKKANNLTLDQFTFYCSIAGIQGYPCNAWYNYCYPL